MHDVSIRVMDVAPAPHAMVPVLNFQLEVALPDRRLWVQSVMLQCQLRIETAARRYPNAGAGLQELFGAPDGWGRSLTRLLWTQTTLTVPSFTGRCRVEMPVHCSFDFNQALTKYLAALEDGSSVPLLLLFSGTVFYRQGDGRLQCGQLSWGLEDRYHLPVAVWRELVDRYHAGTVTLQLDEAVFARLQAFKARRALHSWDSVLAALLEGAEGEANSPLREAAGRARELGS